MTLTERVAYIRGLAEGLGVDENQKEGRVLLAMLELMDDMAESIAELEDENDGLQNIIDAMLEDFYDDDDSYDDEDADIDPDTELYQVVCPSCGEEIYVDELTLDKGTIGCPACGEDLEFDLSALEEEAPAYPQTEEN